VADSNHSVYGGVFQRGEWCNIFHDSTNVSVFRLLGLHDHHTCHPYQLRPGSQNARNSGKYIPRRQQTAFENWIFGTVSFLSTGICTNISTGSLTARHLFIYLFIKVHLRKLSIAHYYTASSDWTINE
jgi:hypothetical protein